MSDSDEHSGEDREPLHRTDGYPLLKKNKVRASVEKGILTQLDDVKYDGEAKHYHRWYKAVKTELEDMGVRARELTLEIEEMKSDCNKNLNVGTHRDP